MRKHISRKHSNSRAEEDHNDPNQIEMDDSNYQDADFENIVAAELSVLTTNTGSTHCSSQIPVSLPMTRFLLELRAKYNVTNVACERVVEEMQDQVSNCIVRTKQIIQDEGLSKEHEQKILGPFEQLHTTLTKHSSTYKQNLMFKKKGFVEPKEILLEGKDSYVYIPILETLKALLQHEDVLALLMHQNNRNNDLISNFTDGMAFKGNEFLQQPNTLRLQVYLDDFQVVSPLGNKTKKHKICAMYWTLGNIPPKFNSKLYTIQLLLLSKSTHIKKYGFHRVLEKMVNDIKILESQGITAPGTTEHFFGTVSVLISDNLAAHEIGGFIESFNSLRTCRFCNITKDEMRITFAEESCHLRSPEQYDSQLDIVDGNPTSAIIYGLKKHSALNQLAHFHICWGSPSDLSHDLFEGFACDLITMTVQHCIGMKFFSLDFLNDQIDKHPYNGKDKTNKPAKLGSDVSKKKIFVKQTAAQCNCLLHLLPLFVAGQIPEDNSQWLHFIEFLDILDLILAPELNKGQIWVMSGKIQNFLEDLYAHNEVWHVKPKGHYLLHYAKQYETFGPLVNLSTLRFEGKHAYLKSSIASSKNYRNPCLTMATKHQYLQSYHHQGNYYLQFDAKKYIKGTSVPLVNMNENLIELITPKVALGIQSVLKVYNSVLYNGIKYERGNVVVVGFSGDDYQFAFIENVTELQNRPWLIVRTCETLYFDAHKHGYVLKLDGNMRIENVDNLFNIFTLPAYQLSTNYYFTILSYFIQPE